MRQNEVKHREYPFFYFTSIARTANNDHLFAKVQDRKVRLPGTIGLRIGQERRGSNNGPFRTQNTGLRLRTQKQVVCKKVLISCFSNYPDGRFILLIGTGIGIPYIKIVLVHVSRDLLKKRVEFFRGNFDVDVAPPYRIFCDVITNDEPVFW
ncbi:hypothetical protein D3C87_1315380 [compost metagenome]